MDISKILYKYGLITMSKDTEVIDRIFNLLTEGESVTKIEGLISTTEILTYGGEIDDSKAKLVYLDILNWWEANKFHIFYEPTPKASI